MTHRHSYVPTEWLIVARRSESCWPGAVRRLPSGSGVLVVGEYLAARQHGQGPIQLRRICRRRRLALVFETSARAVARVHNSRELRRALSAQAALILLSPIFRTRSHPEWDPLPRMRAATLARLAGGRAIALGGMDRRRFKDIQKLGFAGWAAIDAWIRT